MNSTTVTSRLDSVRFIVQDRMMTILCEHRKQEACMQLHGVSAFASMLAMRRGLNPEPAAIAGLLHNFYFYITGIGDFPGPNSAEAARPTLRDMKIFTQEEQLTILRAIFYHGDIAAIHGPYEEVLKDARILQDYVQNLQSGGADARHGAPRLRSLLQELAMPAILPENEPDNVAGTGDQAGTDKRGRLADIAEALAGIGIIGVPGDLTYREICMDWPDLDIHKGLQNSWCAAFVYHCCRQAGFRMPIRYPNGIYRFAGVGAWLQWARMPEHGFFHEDGVDGFVPQRGDIVIYEKLLSDDSHDHIGVVLGSSGEEITVAEGNRDNQNHSAVSSALYTRLYSRRQRLHVLL